MANYKLTDYGTIIDCDDRENNLDYYLKMWKDRDNTLYFSSDSNTFELDGQSLVLSEKQKELLKQKRPSSEVSKLIAYSEECQYQKREEEISQNFLDTGEFPTDTEELAILKEYYRKELSSTNASIIKNTIISSIMPITIAATSYLTYWIVSPDDLASKIIIGSLSFLLGVTVSLIPGQVMEEIDIDPLPFGKIIDSIRKKGVLENKINYLDKSEEKRIALEAERNLTPEGLKNQEVKSMANNKNIFLQALEEVKNKIAKLPEEERNQYFDDLIKIVRTYNNKVAAILDRDNNKVVLGDDANLWSLNVSLLPELFNLDGRIDQRLATLKEKQEIKSSLNQFEASINELKTNKGYTDGWSDDLTSGGVAYASIEDETATSRRMA